MDLVVRDLGPEGKVKVEIVGGKLVLSAMYDSAGLDGELKMSVDSDYFIDELANKIPGQIDDAIFAVLKAALKQL